MRKTHKNFEQDERHTLYKEYLRIVADHEPAVFVMVSGRQSINS